jgi:Domain of unknown function (DUF2431)
MGKVKENGAKKGSGKGWKSQQGGAKPAAGKSKASGASSAAKASNKPWGGNKHFHDVKGGTKKKGKGGRGKAKAEREPKASDTRKAAKCVSYDRTSSILVCGDGDFSFTRGLLQHRSTGAGVVATSFDSRDAVLSKYPVAERWLDALPTRGAKVMHTVYCMTAAAQAATPAKRALLCQSSLNQNMHTSTLTLCITC